MKTYITNDVATFMNFKMLNEVTRKQSLFGGTEIEETVHKNYVIEVNSIDNKYKCKFKAFGTP